MRRAIQRTEPIRFLGECRLEFLQRLCRFLELQQHLAEQLARGRDRSRRDGALLRLVFGVGGRAHLGKRVGFSSLRQREPRQGPATLDVDLLGPVPFVRLRETIADLLQRVDRRSGRREIAGVRGAERAGEVGEGVGVRQAR